MSDDAESPPLKNLGLLHDQIAAAVRAHYGGRLATVGEYDPVATDTKSIKTPAILLELVEIRPAGSKSGGRTPLQLAWSAHCILSAATDNVQREVRDFASQTLCLVHGNRWGLGAAVERAAELEAFPGAFKPGEHGFESWIVNWTQTVHLGDCWELPVDGPPTEVWLGSLPNVGADHHAQYEKVN